jgi:peptide chain release factor 2
MVKDHRSNYETSDAEGVLDGSLDGFVNAYLTHTLGRSGEKKQEARAGG